MTRFAPLIRSVACALSVGLCLVVFPVAAATITHDNLPAFLADTKSLTLEDFDSAPWDPPNTSLPQPVQNLGVSWTSDEGLVAQPTLSLSAPHGISADDLSSGGTLTDRIEAELPAGVRAIGGWVAPVGSDTRLNAYNTGGSLLGSADAPLGLVIDFVFVGIASTDTDIARVEFVSLGAEPNDDFAMDDFYFGEWVPEPSTALLAALALCGVGRRRLC